MDEEQKIYLETLKELNTRSISTRRITITFIYILLLATALVLTGIFAIKSKNNNPITNFISSMIDGNNELYQATTILNNYTKALEAFSIQKHKTYMTKIIALAMPTPLEMIDSSYNLMI